MESVPFKIAGLYGDLAEATGLASFENETLVLEFQTRDTVLGLLKSEIKEERIALDDVQSIGLRKKFLALYLVVRVKRMGALAHVPGSESGEIRLRIERKKRALAEEFVSEVEYRLSEYRLAQLYEE